MSCQKILVFLEGCEVDRATKSVVVRSASRSLSSENFFSCFRKRTVMLSQTCRFCWTMFTSDGCTTRNGHPIAFLTYIFSWDRYRYYFESLRHSTDKIRNKECLKCHHGLTLSSFITRARTTIHIVKLNKNVFFRKRSIICRKRRSIQEFKFNLWRRWAWIYTSQLVRILYRSCIAAIKN